MALADEGVDGRRPEERALLQARPPDRLSIFERAPHAQIELVQV